MLAFPYHMMQAPQSLSHQNNTSHAPLQGSNSLGYQQPIILGGSSSLSGSPSVLPSGGVSPAASSVYGSQTVVSQGPASGGGAVGVGVGVAAAKKRKMSDAGSLASMVNIKEEPG